MKTLNHIVIAGGTGFLGKVLTNHFKSKARQITILTRSHKVDYDNVQYVKWDGESMGYWTKYLEGADVVINLNGRSVDCRYTEENKQLIYNTRLDATYVLGKAIEQCENPPKLWINGASATIYRHSLRDPMDEVNGEFGTGFSVDVCKKWEDCFNSFHLKNTRQVLLRIAIVLGRNDGALVPLKGLTKLGFGGKMGSGYQMFSWLHEDDFVDMVEYCIYNQSVRGAYNACAPNPIRNQWLHKSLRDAMKVRFGFPLKTWILKLGARIIGTETELILKSRYVIPKRFLDEGYEFKYERIEVALNDLCRNYEGMSSPESSFQLNELASDPPSW